MSVLFINACVRKNSRTKIVAEQILKDVTERVEQLNLEEIAIEPLNQKRLAQREQLISIGKYDDEIFKFARQFSQASEIIIAAPFWDLSFPSLLKIYLENVTVSGVTFRYDNGIPTGLCKAKKLTYVTTSGGKIFQDFGYSYVKTLATAFYGIKEVVSYKVENLDVLCVQGEAVLQQEIIKEN